MPESDQPGTAVDKVAVGPPSAMLTDDEIRRTYRVAEALYASGMWKDVKRAEAAFAKMVIGRDLGMTPAQAMQGIHMVEGGIQLHYAMLGQFIRTREGYDYRTGWIKVQPKIVPPEDPTDAPEYVFVWHDEEDPLDTRDVVGAVVEFTVDGQRRGLSRFTVEDAKAANLIKDGLDKRAAWATSRRNMLLARAMSNGVKWFVPEVMQGLPVYVDGEIPEQPSLTAGTGHEDAQGLDLGPKVEKVIERAQELGHVGLSNRAAVEIAVGNRAPGVVNEWVERAKEELERFAKEKAEAAEAAEEPVVPEEEVTGDVVPDGPEDDPQARLADSLAAEGQEVAS